MDPERWARVKELFHAALACEPERRKAFLLEAAGDDASLREAVQSMLARQRDASRFLEVPALEAAAMALAAEIDPAGSSSLEPPPLPARTSLSFRRRASTRPPWWMLLLAAVLLADSALRAWCHVAGPGGIGFTGALEGGSYVVTAVTAGGLAEKAGIEEGDVIIARDGRAYETVSNGRVTRPNLEVGRTYFFEVERNGQLFNVAIAIRRPAVTLGRLYLSAALWWQVAMFAMLATAFLIAFTRPRDFMARLGALTLAALGVSFWLFNLPTGYAAIVRNLPWGLGILALVPNLLVVLAGPIGLTFFLLFPRPLFRARWPWVFVWLPAICLVPAFVDASLIIYWPDEAYVRNVMTERVRQLAGGAYTAYGLMMLAAVSANYARLADVNDKRRLRVLVAGGAAGTLPGLGRLVVVTVAPGSALADYVMYGWPDGPIALGFLLFPISFAYALLRHRVLGVRVIIRLGLQYALARGLVISLVPILGLVLVLDALAHGDQPLIQIVEARGWAYALLAALAVVVHAQRHRMGNAIDRRFFREHYDARRLLRDVVEKVRHSGNLEDAAPAVVARIEAALHPMVAALLVRAPGHRTFVPLASAPAGTTPPAVGEGSPIVAQMRATDSPVHTSGWYNNRGEEWPPEGAPDQPYPIELAVPIVVSAEYQEALLAFGPKRSEEPYTQEDVDSLAAIAASLALLLERPSSQPDRLPSTFEECPECGRCYDTGASSCGREETPLVHVTMARTLAGRYRLERRLGRGGMGKVYEATDTSLDRRVAVKVIRDEWVHSTAAIERFRREAKAVAAFDHPNVVTVHDYGVEAGRRAFLVMELLSGVTLRDELVRATRLDAVRTIEVFRGVCAAVAAAHRNQIVHRDLKPGNIFLAIAAERRATTVKVLDFGVAKVLAGPIDEPETVDATETGMGVMVGTVGYMPPEQLLGDRPGVSWDLWALAVVAYECLTGALPFPITSREAWRRSVLSGMYTPLTEHLGDPPGSWGDFFARSLSTDRSRRPQSSPEFLQELEQALA